MKVALGIQYDGTPFSGWQVQPDRPTVQQTLEEALGAFAGIGQPVPTICAGRTDTGVHATGQVVHIEAPVERPMNAWVRGTNSFLPPAVAVRWAKPVPEDFSARFSAIGRTYEYWIVNEPVRVPLLAGRAGWCFRPCDVEKMEEAAAVLLGEHDFTSFRAAECQAKSPVRRIDSIRFTVRGNMIGIRFEANAFLQHMVRNLVGSLVYVGIGKKPVGWLADVLEARNRALAAPTYAPDGLYLVGVNYGEAGDAAGLPRYSPTFMGPF